ncbi:conserved hypothetical protein [Trichinella spiralis]|uniref:hypothetical protein n=1 Tax=Trichinella spiralis TaxID=6334 RepID=UPI0001EFE62D|nr:conserved hypothetical protein [Trichinella spiralis]
MHCDQYQFIFTVNLSGMMSFFSCDVSCMPPSADGEVCFKKVRTSYGLLMAVRSVETPNETISDEEPLQSFDEWTKKKLEEQQNLKPIGKGREIGCHAQRQHSYPVHESQLREQRLWGENNAGECRCPERGRTA